MSAYNSGVTLGTPGSFPLPVKGAQGTAFTAGMKMHPAAAAAMPSRQNPLNALPPGAAPAGGHK
jgi:hypothetical protein